MENGTFETQGSRPLALVTGASTGIGRAFVALLARDGYDIIAVARSREPMEAQGVELARDHGASLTALVLDLTAPEATDKVYEAVECDGRRLSLLVNNAGFGVLGAFDAKPRADALGMVTLNTSVVVDLTHRFLPDLVATRGGVINVASLSAYMPMPWLTVYSATKSFVKIFTKMLAVEISAKGVRITAVCPGYTKTQFHARTGVDKVSVPGFVPMQSPEAVAAQGYRGWQRGKVIVVTGWANKLTACTAWLLQPVFNLIGRVANQRVNAPRGETRENGD